MTDESISDQTQDSVSGSPISSMTGLNKLLLLLAVLVGVAFIGQYAAQTLLKNTQTSLPPEPLKDTFVAAEITIPAKYVGNPYTNPEPFNITSFYLTIQQLNEVGGKTPGTLVRTNEGIIEDVSLDEKNKTVSITIKDKENHLLRFEYTGAIYDKIVISSLEIDTNPLLSSLTKGDNIRILDEYNVRAKSYESSVMSVTIIRL